MKRHFNVLILADVLINCVDFRMKRIDTVGIPYLVYTVNNINHEEMLQ